MRARWRALAVLAVLALPAWPRGTAVAGPAAKPAGQPVAKPAAKSPAAAARAETPAPPATLLSGEAVQGTAIDPVLAHLQLERLRCTFSEEKHIALLARPLRSTGTLTFVRDQGIARVTLTPRPQQVVLTRTSLRIQKGKHVEEIPLDKSKDLKAFALIFPSLLSGDRAGLESAFSLGLHGSEQSWWALVFTPKAESLRKLVRRVVVFGRKGEVVSLQVVEASGDTTDTQLSEIHQNGDVSDAEIAAAFGAP